MKMQWALAVTLGLVFANMPVFAEEAMPAAPAATPSAPAATPAPSTSPTSMTKDAWLSQLNTVLPSLICKSFLEEPSLKKRFEELNLTYDQCVSYIPASAEKCQKELYDTIPNMIDIEAANKWGRSYGECIGKDFAEKYLVRK